MCKAMGLYSGAYIRPYFCVKGLIYGGVYSRSFTVTVPLYDFFFFFFIHFLKSLYHLCVRTSRFNQGLIFLDITISSKATHKNAIEMTSSCRMRNKSKLDFEFFFVLIRDLIVIVGGQESFHAYNLL